MFMQYPFKGVSIPKTENVSTYLKVDTGTNGQARLYT